MTQDGRQNISHIYIKRKKEITTGALTSQPPSAGLVELRLEHLVGNLDVVRKNTKLSLDKGISLCSIYARCSTITLQLFRYNGAASYINHVGLHVGQYIPTRFIH